MPPSLPHSNGTHRAGRPVAGLLLTILATNIASSRGLTSLPYLPHGAPQPLRFAPSVVMIQPPLRPWSSRKRSLADAANSTRWDDIRLLGEADAAPDGADAVYDLPPPPTAPEAATGETPVVAAEGPANSPGISILPDTFAPRPNLQVEQFLPFFVAPSAPTSRATYELK
jgi:hypothetical protein